MFSFHLDNQPMINYFFTMKNDTTLSERITACLTKKIKKEKRISQADLAEKMGIAPASVNKWLSGGTPAIDKLPRLCDILGITPNELFGYEEEGFPQEAIDLYKAFQKHPEYHNSIKKLLNMVVMDIEN